MLGEAPNGDSWVGYTKRVIFGCGKLYLTINLDAKGKPAKILAQLGKTGCCQRALLDGLVRTLNTQLDDGKSLDEISINLIGIRCDQGIAGAGRLSCVDAIGNELKAYAVEVEA